MGFSIKDAANDVKDAVEETADKAEKVAEDAKEAAENAAKTAAEATEKAAENAANAAEEAATEAEDAANDAAEAAEESAEDARHAVASLADINEGLAEDVDDAVVEGIERLESTSERAEETVDRASEAAEAATRAAEKAMEATEEEVENAVAESAEAVQEAAESAAEAAEEVAETAEEAASDAKQAAADLSDPDDEIRAVIEAARDFARRSRWGLPGNRLHSRGPILSGLFRIPFLGALLQLVVNTIDALLTTAISAVAEYLVTPVFRLITGQRPVKTLDVCLIILEDTAGTIPNQGQVRNAVTAASTNILEPEADVRINISGIEPSDPAPRAAYDIGCGAQAFVDDIWIPGMYFDDAAEDHCGSAFPISYGSPIVVFVVDNIDGALGCSMGPATNYVTVDQANAATIAHEIGHACGLTHSPDPNNLMDGGTQLNDRQEAVIRASDHVTFF